VLVSLLWKPEEAPMSAAPKKDEIRVVIVVA